MRFAILSLCALVGIAGLVSATPKSPADLSKRIDHHLAARWTSAKIKPAEPTDDATFVRRVYLDLTGRIPTVAEVRSFLAEKSPEKRVNLITRLLGTAAYARHWATFWRREWIPQIDTPQFAGLADDIQGWLAGRLREKVGYDRIVRDLMTTNRLRNKPGAPTTFLAASEYRPENLAANTTRAFLGINLDCAQCHDHPFARWSREQFWQTAAFFARPSLVKEGLAAKLEVVIPATNKAIGPRLLTDPQPTWTGELKSDTGRIVLADWVIAKTNPYFAKNAVNRVWANVYGTGLVEPLDDLSGENPASHPELLEELAKAFIDSDYNLQFLIQAFMQSRAYQLSSKVGDGKTADPHLFGHAAVRGLTGEQLYDSLRVAAGLVVEREDLDTIRGLRTRKLYAAKFRIERTGKAQRSILQSLTMMNGVLTAQLTDSAKTPTLRAVVDAPFLDTRGKVETLFLSALSRYPSKEELSELLKYVEKKSLHEEQKAFGDLFWSLLNSSEFSTNH